MTEVHDQPEPINAQAANTPEATPPHITRAHDAQLRFVDLRRHISREAERYGRRESSHLRIDALETDIRLVESIVGALVGVISRMGPNLQEAVFDEMTRSISAATHATQQANASVSRILTPN